MMLSVLFSNLKDFISHNDDILDSKLVPLYGTLGQSYITEEDNNLTLDTAMSMFGSSIGNMVRTYSNFMLLYIVSNSSKEFEEALLSYIKLNNCDDLNTYMKGLSIKDRNDIYLVKRLLSFCN